MHVAEIAAAHHTPKVNCVKRNEKKAGVEVVVCSWGSLSTLMGQTYSKAEKSGGLDQRRSISILLGQAQITKENILSFKKSYYVLELRV